MMTHKIALIGPLLLIAACSEGSGGPTTTKLDAVEVEPGTASDAMILLDDSDVDGTAVDNSGGALTAEGAAAAKAQAEKASEAATTEESDPAATTTAEAEKSAP